MRAWSGSLHYEGYPLFSWLRYSYRPATVNEERTPLTFLLLPLELGLSRERTYAISRETLIQSWASISTVVRIMRSSTASAMVTVPLPFGQTSVRQLWDCRSRAGVDSAVEDKRNRRVQVPHRYRRRRTWEKWGHIIGLADNQRGRKRFVNARLAWKVNVPQQGLDPIRTKTVRCDTTGYED